jgi:hypothetical protein
VKIPDLFIELYLVKGAGRECYLYDLVWAWKLFTAETGVQAPEDWLRALILCHGVVLKEPAPGQTWRGWRVQGLALNPPTLLRYTKHRLERIGLCTHAEGTK